MGISLKIGELTLHGGEKQRLEELLAQNRWESIIDRGLPENDDNVSMLVSGEQAKRLARAKQEPKDVLRETPAPPQNKSQRHTIGS